jgi:hypothetical protein
MRMAGKLEKALTRAAMCTAVLSVCMTAAFPGVAMDWTASPGVTGLDGAPPCRWCVLFARVDDAGMSASGPLEDAAPEARKDPESDSKTSPAESEPDRLEEFRPTEEIEADQGVDFPYDI